MDEYLAPANANYKVWWKRRSRSDADPLDGSRIVVGHMEASRFLGIKKTELGDKYNVGMFRASDELPASTASQEV